MSNITSAFRNVTMDEQGITLAATWCQQSASIPWNHVLAIAATEYGKTKICYAAENGRIRRIILGDQKRYQAQAVTYWKQTLVTNVVTAQAVTGASVHFLSRWERTSRLVGLLVGIGFFGYGLFVAVSTSWTWLQDGGSEFHQLIKWVAYYGIVPTSIPLVTCVTFLVGLIASTVRLKRWRTWHVSTHGLVRQRSNQHWESLSFCAEDQICPNRVIIGGERLPLWQAPVGGMTHNAILPHILAILAKRQHIVPTPGQRDFPLGIAVRFAVFWPLVILSLWYAPLLVWKVPSELDVTIPLNVSVVLGGCGVASLGFWVAYLLERPRYQERFVTFLAEIEQIQRQLQWE